MAGTLLEHQNGYRLEASHMIYHEANTWYKNILVGVEVESAVSIRNSSLCITPLFSDKMLRLV
jgi:hypothetical protein